MDLSLPGRTYSEDDNDYEACNALRTLLEAEAIKCSANDDLLERIGLQLDRHMDLMSRVRSSLEEDGPQEPGLSLVTGSATRTDSRTIDDFYARLNAGRKKEHAKNLTPLRG